MTNLVKNQTETKEIVSVKQNKYFNEVTVKHEDKLYSIAIDRSDIQDWLIDNHVEYADMLASFHNLQDLSASEIADEISFNVWRDTDTIAMYVQTIDVSEMEEVIIKGKAVAA